VRSKTVILFILLSWAKAYPQQLSHQVLLPAAGVIYTGGLSYSQTIGETAVEIFNSVDFSLTQGFQQPRITFLPGVPPPGNGVRVYPNPAIDFVNIELFGETERTFRIKVSNISGNIVFSDDLRFSGNYWYLEEIPLTGFPKGLYFIQVISTDGTINRSFKIEKL
jgi:hypothetical protein